MTDVISLTDHLKPFLEYCDRAIAENVRLVGLVKDLQQELRYSQDRQDRAFDRCNALEQEKEAALAEVAMLKTRMKVFGDAASMILSEAPTGQMEGVMAQANERRLQQRHADVLASPAATFLNRLQ
jgi:hypothetical protein